MKVELGEKKLLSSKYFEEIDSNSLEVSFVLHNVAN